MDNKKGQKESTRQTGGQTRTVLGQNINENILEDLKVVS
jgi:hypothetical protein